MDGFTVSAALNKCVARYLSPHLPARKDYPMVHCLYTLLCAVLGVFVFCGEVLADQPPGFKLHGRFTGIGSCLAKIIGPGNERGTERLYASHVYYGNTFDVVAIDPLTGTTDVFINPLASEYGAWAMVLGRDSNVYIGTLPNAHIMRLDWKSKSLVDMGRPSSTEKYIWQMVGGSDENIYGCTYPNAKLIRFNPVTGKSEDLGRMSETEKYSRSIAADSKGFVYVGIGMAKRDLVAYEIATGKHRSILPQNMGGNGTVSVVQGVDGIIYANAEDKWIRLDGFTATPLVGEANIRPRTPRLTLADGRRLNYDGFLMSVQDRNGKLVPIKTGYRGKMLSIFRICQGPDDKLYGGTGQPGHFFSASPENDHWEEIAVAGTGEIYSFLAWQDRLIMAAYSFPSPIMIFKPGQPWKPGPQKDDNPRQIHFKGEKASWRPMAMIAGPQDKVYIGAVSGYGLLGGPLCVFDPVTGRLDQYMHLVTDHSVISLAVTIEGIIVGGTTTGGGGGSHPTQDEAKIFLWDPVKREKIFETVVTSENSSIDALCLGKNGLVYGFGNQRRVMFVFDPRARKIISVKPSGLGNVITNAIGRAVDGNLYGLHSGGIFKIDEEKHIVKQIANSPLEVTGGFAIRGKHIYFTSGPQIISYTLP